MDLGGSLITPNPGNLHEPHFTHSSPIPNKPQAKKPLASSGRSNSREMIGTSYEGWRPEKLPNGNYRQIPAPRLRPDPDTVLGVTTHVRTGITADTSGTLISIAPYD